MGLRLAGDLHKELKGISEQSGLPISFLLRRGAELLVEETKKTGRVPVPAVNVGTNDEETE